MQPKRTPAHPVPDLVSFLTSLVVLVTILSGCGTTMHLPSHWPQQRMIVDGKNTEWAHTYLIDNNKLVIGFVNDSSFVYVLLATNDRPLAMSMMRGLTVWFDSKGGDDKTFGIRYPLGGMFRREGSSGGSQNEEPSMESGRFGLSPTELEILGPGKDDRHKMQIMETGGIEARYTMTVNSFVYELRVPFTEGDQFPFAIKSKLGNVVGLGLEAGTSRMQRPSMEGRGERGTSEGAEGGEEGGFEDGGMRGGRGGRGGFGQGGRRESAGPLDVWMKVRLVAKDTAAS